MSTFSQLSLSAMVFTFLVVCTRASGQQPDPAAPKTPPAQPQKGQSLDKALLFFPSKYPEGNWKPEGLQFEDAWFNAKDGPRLHGWYCPCDKPRDPAIRARKRREPVTSLAVDEILPKGTAGHVDDL